MPEPPEVLRARNTLAQVLDRVINEMAGIGVDFSVPASDLRQWLVNPDTPYPAIAEAVLGMQHRLKSPVYLDVVVWNYEHTPGVASPRQFADVRPDVLQAAIVSGSNTRYGTNVTTFDQLLSA